METSYVLQTHFMEKNGQNLHSQENIIKPLKTKKHIFLMQKKHLNYFSQPGIYLVARKRNN